MFEVTHRDELARISTWQCTTPNILFIHTKRFKAPEAAEILLVKRARKLDKPYLVMPKEQLHYPPSMAQQDLKNADLILDEDLVVLRNAALLYTKPKALVNAVVNLKKRFGPGKLIYAPGIGRPHSYALLVHLGIDLFDSARLITSARRGLFLTTDGILDESTLLENPCECAACRSGAEGFERLLRHNYHAASNELKRVRNAIRAQRLRELAELRAHTSPHLVATLREYDKCYAFREPYVPMTKGTLMVTSEQSLHRPEIARFQNRLKARYTKPEGVRVLVLLPCSKRKPYSFSKSHRTFRRAINELPNRHIVHEVMVTSPLGIVPRELELYYPAQHYDIPVTGDWDGYEIAIINGMIEWLLANNDYDAVLNHTGYGFIDVGQNTCKGSPTSNESSAALKAALTQAVERYASEGEGGPQPPPATKKRILSDMSSRVRFQFGQGAETLLTDTVIRGRYPNLKIINSMTAAQLGMLVGARGMISLTLDGARFLARLERYRVKIEDFTPKGDVFAVGVTDADADIRIGDDVVVMHEDEVRAVGVAMMSSPEMLEHMKGKAVKVRHS